MYSRNIMLSSCQLQMGDQLPRGLKPVGSDIATMSEGFPKLEETLHLHSYGPKYQL